MENLEMETNPRTGLDKIKQYAWSMVDQKGGFRYITKHSLKVDNATYQRDPPTEEQVTAIAKEWSWIGCGALVVADRGPDGYWLIDGQRRWLAALRRSDIKDLPCMVFTVDDVKPEAKGFLAINLTRRPPKWSDRFKAMVAEGDENALYVDHLLRRVGRTYLPSSVAGISVLVDAARRNRNMLTRLWPLLHLLHDNRPIMEMVVSTFLYIEQEAADGQSLSDPKWEKRLLRIGVDELVETARRLSFAKSKGGPKVNAEGFLERINRRLHNEQKFRLMK